MRSTPPSISTDVRAVGRRIGVAWPDGQLKSTLGPRFADRPVASITPAEIAAMRDELIAAGLKPRTVVRHLTVAHGILRHAVREYGLARNPASAELVDRPTVRYSGEFQTLEAEELAALA